MTQPDGPQSEPPPGDSTLPDRSMNNETPAPSQEIADSNAVPEAQSVVQDQDPDQVHAAHPEESTEPVSTYREPKQVVPGLPRAQTFKRQLSEQRCHLEPVEYDPDERRAMSVDRRWRATDHNQQASWQPNDHLHMDQYGHEAQLRGLGDVHTQEGVYPDHISEFDLEKNKQEHSMGRMSESIGDDPGVSDGYASSLDQDHEYEHDEEIRRELENLWILNLSMRYKDQSDREKFFVTYREHEHHWRRVTVTLDYRHVPEGSLEEDLHRTKMQRHKSRKIYDAIRESLQEIQFYETVTNLKLETLGNRLHVHVVEDTNEVIHFPTVKQIRHLQCPLIREQDIVFDHHMSGFVYKVYVEGKALIKKEIPGPDTIEEFLYEINALNSLAYSDHVIEFYGLVVDEDQRVKGLLINFADGGALIDIIYDNCKNSPENDNKGIQWSLKEHWARQIVHGLADVHESGFVQGDFTLSNIVIDENDDAKIIDINRRGCPVGWEPPEATPLIESGHRISMYIGVKSDLYQLGMVLWALAMGEDEPEREGRPLTFGNNSNIPDWYQRITNICLDPDPRRRYSAARLALQFPEELSQAPHISIDDGISITSVPVEEYHPDGQVRGRSEGPSYNWWRTGHAHMPYGYAPRGRSPPRAPPSPLPSNCDSPQRFHSHSGWAANKHTRASYSDTGDEMQPEGVIQPQLTPSASAELRPLLSNRNLENHIAGPPDMEQGKPADYSHESAQEVSHEDVATPTADSVAQPNDDKSAVATEQAHAIDEMAGKDARQPISDAVLQDASGVVAQDHKLPQVEKPAALGLAFNHCEDGRSSDDDKTIPADQRAPSEIKSDDVTEVDLTTTSAITQAVMGGAEVGPVEKGTPDQPACMTEGVAPETRSPHAVTTEDVASDVKGSAGSLGGSEIIVPVAIDAATEKNEIPIRSAAEVTVAPFHSPVQLQSAIDTPLEAPQETAPASKDTSKGAFGLEEQKDMGVVHTTCELPGNTEPSAQKTTPATEVPAARAGGETVTDMAQPQLDASKGIVECIEPPGNQASTPRTWPSGQEGAAKLHDPLAYVGEHMSFHDDLVHGQDLLDEDFQISGIPDIRT